MFPKSIARRMQAALLSSLCAISGAFAQPLEQSQSPAAGEALVTVGGKPITRADLEFQYVTRNIPDDGREAIRGELIERLIDDRLMRSFLEARDAAVTQPAIEAEIERLRETLRAAGKDPRKVLGGYDEAALRRVLALPIAWRDFARETITPESLRTYFEKHRRKFDGTELKAAQIFLKATTDIERAAALKKLAAFKQQIEGGMLTFPNAARLHSQAPTAAVAGDVGFFPYRGTMPEAFTREAFAIEKGKIGQPFTTPFGAHLVMVTDVRPGQLSLEDVRNEVFDALATELWNEIVTRERETTTIERHSNRPE